MDEIQSIVTQLHYRNELWAIMIPIALMALDILTGLINAWIKNEIDSAKLRKGLAKKMGEITVILIGELFVIGFCLPNVVFTGISIYLVIMELISICENLEKIGVPIPKFIKNALAVSNEKIQNGSKDNKEEDKDGSEENTSD